MLGYGGDETPPLDSVEELATALDAGPGLVTLHTSLRAGRRDLTVPPLLEAPPIPVAFTLGSDEAAAGQARAGHPPVGTLPKRLGPEARPALHYPLGDGTDPGTWGVFQRLLRHLQGG